MKVIKSPFPHSRNRKEVISTFYAKSLRKETNNVIMKYQSMMPLSSIADSDTERKRLEFWTQFNEVLEMRGKPFNKRKAATDHW